MPESPASKASEPQAETISTVVTKRHYLRVIADSMREIDQSLRWIARCLTRPPVRFRVDTTAIGDKNMAKAHAASVDITIFDNGQVLFTANPVDAAGFPPAPTPVFDTPPTSVASDPTLLDLSPSTDGLSALGTPKGLGVVTVTFNGVDVSGGGAGVPLTGTSGNVTIVAGPAGSFVVTEQSNTAQAK